jgi:hypothetical protein
MMKAIIGKTRRIFNWRGAHFEEERIGREGNFELNKKLCLCLTRLLLKPNSPLSN